MADVDLKAGNANEPPYSEKDIAPDRHPSAETTPHSMAADGASDAKPEAAEAATTLSDAGAAPDRPSNRINDERFIKDLERLKDLRSFLIQEAVSLSGTDSAALEFGQLNLLRFNNTPFGGRDPTEEEWNKVERQTRILFGLLTPPLRRRFLLGAIPGLLAWLPIILAPAALAALILAIIAPRPDFLGLGLGPTVLPLYLIWLMSLGAIGAVAFIGMNALSVQEDITFDLTNQRLIVLRIALGALFGLVLSLPIGFDGFLDFCSNIWKGAKLAGDGGGAVTMQAMMLVLPFILGFSTSLVILILNRFVDAVQGFFGRRDAPNALAGASAAMSAGEVKDGGAAASTSGATALRTPRR